MAWVKISSWMRRCGTWNYNALSQLDTGEGVSFAPAVSLCSQHSTNFQKPMRESAGQPWACALGNLHICTVYGRSRRRLFSSYWTGRNNQERIDWSQLNRQLVPGTLLGSVNNLHSVWGCNFSRFYVHIDGPVGLGSQGSLPSLQRSLLWLSMVVWPWESLCVST